MKQELNIETKKSRIKIFLIAVLMLLFSSAIFLASCSLGNIKVTYTAVDGETVEMTFKKGITIGELDEAKYVVGYTFEGWYQDSSKYVRYEDDDVLDGDTTIYPNYVAKKYQVIFYSNNDKNESNVRIYSYNSKFKLPTNTFTSNYQKFEGWSKNKNDVAGSSTIEKVGKEVQLTTEGAVYYAIWSGNTIDVEYEFSDARLDGEMINTTDVTLYPSSAIFGGNLTLPTFTGNLTKVGDTYSDYVFAGFNINGVVYAANTKLKVDASIIDNGKITLTIEWRKTNEGVASFNLNQPANDQKPIAQPANITVERNGDGNFVFTLPGCADLYGHNFTGWKVGDTLITTPTYTTTNGLTTFFADWEVQSRTITLSDGGQIIDTISVNYGESVNLTTTHNATDVDALHDFTNTDKWEFVGWKKELPTENATTNYAGDVTILFASDECIYENETYKITLYGNYSRKQITLEFIANGGNGGIDDIRVNTCEAFEVSEELRNELYRQYYTLVGFSTDAASLIGSNTINVGTEDLTLYAVWSRNKVTVTYTNAEQATTPGSVQVDQGSNFVLSRTGFAYSGYELIGFKISGDETETIYPLGDSLFLEDNVTLIPQWSPLRKINFRGAGEIDEVVKTDGSKVAISALTVGDKIVLPTYASGYSYVDESSTRYYFAGWATDETQTYPTLFANTEFEITENFDLLYAVYMPATAGLSYTLNSDGTAGVYYNGSGTSDNHILIYPNVYTDGSTTYRVTKLENRLSTATKPTTAQHVIIASGIEAIGDNSFRGCASITDILIPSSVSRIGAHSLRETGISYIAEQDGSMLNKIDAYAFYNCGTLNNFLYNANSSLATIGESAFASCVNLRSVIMPSSVATVGASAFLNCVSLQNVRISRSLGQIQTRTFEGCYSIETVTFETNSSLISIGGSSFLNASAIRTLAIPESVQTIAKNAFEGCSSLESVSFPSTLKTIEEKAFYNCSNIRTLTFSSAITNLTIGKSAFESCSKLQQLNLPETVASIGTSAFKGCSRLTEITFLTNSAQASERKYMAVGNCLIEKSTNTLILGCKNSSLETAELEVIESEIHDGILKIADYAFYGCSELASFKIPSTVTNIGSYAFFQNIALATLYIDINNSALKTVGNYAFYGCSSLTSINFPENLTTIGENAFYHCTNLLTVNFAENSRSITIGTKAFYNCSSLVAITIPGTMNNIGSYAFTGCTHLVAATFGDTTGWAAGTIMISSIDLADVATAANYLTRTYSDVTWSKPTNYLTFELLADNTYQVSLSGLTEDYSIGGAIVVPSSYDEVAVTQVKAGGFSGSEAITSISIPSSVKIIGADAFKDCTNLTSVTLSSGLITIGQNAFKNSGIKAVSIPNTVETIGESAFANCSSLKTVSISTSLNEISTSAFEGCSKITTISIPNSVVTIASNAFKNNTALKTIVLGSGLTTIYANAFAGCGAISSVTFSDLNGWVAGATLLAGSDLNNKSIAATKLKTYADQEWNKNIANYLTFTLVDGTYMVSATAPENIYGAVIIPSTYETVPVTAIGANAFAQGSEITAVVIPKGVKSIGNYAFAGCSNIRTIDFGEVESIGQYALSGCTGLSTIDLPAQLSSIGRNAFENLASNVSINLANPNGWVAGGDELSAETLVANAKTYLTSTKKTVDWNTFDRYLTFTLISSGTNNGKYSVTTKSGVTIYGELYIPGTYNNTQVAIVEANAFENNTTITDVIVAENIIEIGNSAFGYCTNLNSIVLPSTLTKIGEAAFTHCSNLDGVVIPANVWLIKDGTFSYCSSLTSIIIPRKVQEIGAAAFVECTNLENVEFEANSRLTTIGERAFEGCTSLTSFTVVANCEQIQPNAFIGCVNLTDVTFEEIFPWRAGSYVIPNLVLLSTSTAATYLTDTYHSVLWRKAVIVAPIQNGGAFVTEGVYDGEWL